MKILNIKVDQITMPQALEKIEQWLKNSGEKKYIVTPNIEIIMSAQNDKEFMDILNNADLSIPDSARFGWAMTILEEKNFLKRLAVWPLFLAPKSKQLIQFDSLTGTDLMESLIKLSAEKGFTIGLLGGQEKLAEKLKDRLIKKYPNLKIVFTDSGGVIDYTGSLVRTSDQTKDSLPHLGNIYQAKIPPIDILFVAFGHIKQEKWISKNLQNYPVKIMMGVGGAFDYLSGTVPRAPKALRTLGFEWLFRLTTQPWRIIRFYSLVKFIFLILLRRENPTRAT